jgi:hypothetical protein
MRLLVVILCCVSLVACATTQTLPVQSVEDARAAMAPGDTVTLIDTRGRALVLVVTSITPTHVHGEKDGKRYAVPIKSIAQVDRREIDPVRSTGLGGLIAVVVVAAAVGLVLLMADALEDSTRECVEGEADCNASR